MYLRSCAYMRTRVRRNGATAAEMAYGVDFVRRDLQRMQISDPRAAPAAAAPPVQLPVRALVAGAAAAPAAAPQAAPVTSEFKLHPRADDESLMCNALLQAYCEMDDQRRVLAERNARPPPAPSPPPPPPPPQQQQQPKKREPPLEAKGPSRAPATAPAARAADAPKKARVDDIRQRFAEVDKEAVHVAIMTAFGELNKCVHVDGCYVAIAATM